MHIRVCGTRGAFPTNQQMVALHLRTSEGGLLLDVGSTLLFDPALLDHTSHILLSHHHNDHVAMLTHFLIARWHRARNTSKDFQPCLIVSPEPIEDTLNSMGIENSDLYSHTTQVPEEILGLNVRSIVTRHPRLNNCYRLSRGRCSLAYTGDTTYFPELSEFCQGVDLLICEASYGDASLRQALEWGHMTPKMVARLISEAKPIKTLLMHFVELNGQEFADSVLSHLGRWADIVPAWDGFEFEVETT